MIINSTVIWVLVAVLAAVAALLIVMISNLKELHYKLNVIIATENRRQSSFRNELSRIGVQPATRRVF